jgi:hypothetical protein
MEIRDSNKYIGEYFRKDREKKDGHTFKKNYSKIKQKNVSVERNHGGDNMNNGSDKVQEIAVTEIDSYFDYGFWKASFRNYKPDRPFNSPELWENVESELELSALNISREYSRYQNTTTVHYDVPVSGYVLCKNALSKKRRTQQHWLCWNGKYYDPEYIYQHILYEKHGSYSSLEERQLGYLKKICPRVNSKKDPQTALGQISDKLNRIASAVMTKKHKEYLEIDLGKVCELTHIGSLGAYPKRLEIFPRYEEDDYSYVNNVRVHLREKRIPSKYVYIVTDAELSWVTKYSVHYRELHSGKWKLYEHPFEGNIDISSEVIHKISVMCRHLRIVPIECHNKMEMRVLLYGVQDSGKNLEEVDIPTIRYSLVPSCNKLTLDGNGYGRRCWCCYCIGSCNKVKYHRSVIEDGLQEYYDNCVEV